MFLYLMKYNLRIWKNINQIKNKIHEIEEQIKQYEQQMRKKG